MRPSALVTPRAMTAPSCSRETALAEAGRPLAVARASVERVAMSGRYRTPAMTMLRITAGPFTFKARLEEKDAPKTCAAVRKLLPLRSKLVHCRWSGESTWVPMGEKRLGVDFENHTSHPAPGQVLVYPGGFSEMEILFPYGATMFSSKVGQLAGNHFATVVEGNVQLVEIGRLTLWEGAQDFSINEE